jgi:hypothetical protein
MSPAELAILVACVVFMTIGNLAACLLFIRITGQVYRAVAVPSTSEWRRRSPARIKRTFNLHRELYPASRIRMTAAALMGSAIFAFLLMMVLLFSNAPRASRASSSQTIKSLR